MLTTACSKPSAKNRKIGSQIAAILPTVEVEVMRHDDAEADQPVAEDGLDEDADHAGGAERGVADGLGFGDGDDARRDAGHFHLAHIGERDRDQDAEGDAAEQVGDEHPGPVGDTALQLALPSSRASGTTAKLPVTSSSPSSTIITRLTGKISAPTSGWPVVIAPVKASAVAAPSKCAGQRAADQEVARPERQLLDAGINHRGNDVGRFDVIHVEAPAATRWRGHNEERRSCGRPRLCERSDQPRCCGNPSWIWASGHHRRLAWLSLFKTCASAAWSEK